MLINRQQSPKGRKADRIRAIATEYPIREARNPDKKEPRVSLGKALSMPKESPETGETLTKRLISDSKKSSNVAKKSLIFCDEDPGAEDPGALKLDKIDIKILRSLNENARRSYRDITKELHISLRTVSSKIKAMERAGLIQGYIPTIDPTKLGFDITVIIGIIIGIDEKKAVETEKNLAKNPAVFAVFDTTGEWDVLLLARFKSISDLNDFIKKLLAYENVDKAYTQVMLNVTKEEKRVLV